MELIRGSITGAQKICLYGVEGIGKSYFASKFPNPVFIDTEGSTKHMDVARLPNPSSWTMLLEEVQYCKTNPTICDTLVIDTIDWAERLGLEFVTSRANKKSITHFGYGEGFIQLEEEFGKFLNKLTDLIEIGINVVLIAHAKIVRFEQPDEIGTYDRWELKLGNKTTARTAAMLKEWADMVLFANYKVTVVNVDNQGAQKGKNKAQGGKRVMYTTHHPCWDAKNRHDLLDELLLDYDEIKHCIWTRGKAESPPPQQPQAPAPQPQQNIKTVDSTGGKADWSDVGTVYKSEKELRKHLDAQKPPVDPDKDAFVPKALADLMKANDVSVGEIRQAVANRGYYPLDTPIEKYDPKFIQGVLIGAWDQVFQMIKNNRDIPL